MSGIARGGNRGARSRLALACAATLALVVVAGAAGDGPSPFGLTGGPTPLLTTETDPYSVQFADMNGDKKMDLVVADYNDGTTGKVQVFLGNGKAAFSQVSDVDAGSGPIAFVHDVTGDGKPDVVVLNYGDFTGNIETYVNDGTGAIAVHGPQVNTGGQPTALLFGDWNGDHNTDIAVVDGYPANLQFLVGDGQGGFVQSQHVLPDGSAVSGPDGAVVHDFNGDGRDDVAEVNTYGGGESPSQDIQFWMSNGDGTFTAWPTTLSLAGLDPAWLYLVDVNGDKNLDLVTSGLGFVTLLSNGDGGFGAPIVSPGNSPLGVPVDINGDKKLDFYGIDSTNGSAVALFIGNGLGAFAASPVEYPVNAGDNPGAYWIDAADVNGDKHADVAVANGNTNKVSILLWTATLPTLPSITKATPASGTVGSTVVLTGKNLQHVAGVSFGGPLGTITAQPAGGLSLSVTVPAGANYGKLGLISEKGVVASAVTFAPIETPVIASVSPTGGQKAGATITIAGSHFTAVDSVTLGATALTNLKVADAKITATIPLGTAAGSYDLSVGNDVGAGHATYGVAVIPAIDSFLPSHGPANATKTTNVEIDDAAGTLIGASAVLFHGKPGKNLVVSTDGTSLTVDAPAGATTGTVTVTTPAGSATSAAVFTVDPQPSITLLSATNGVSGDTITVNGKNLIGITSVRFNGVPGANLDTTSAPASVTIQVPAHAGIGKVTAIGLNGTATSGQAFTPYIAPILSAFTPSIGALPGATITVSGFHFVGTKSVTFASPGVPITAKFKLVSDTSLSLTIPSTAITGTVSVTNAYGTTGSDYYVVQSPFLNGSGSFSPTAGPVGQQVTITGQRLGGATSVTFGGHSASFVLDSDTQITATAPAGFTNGAVAVTNAAGTVSTIDQFTEVAISGFGPSGGGIGTVVTITGTGLLAVTGVQLPGQGVADPSNLTATSFDVTVQSCGTSATGTITIYVGSVTMHTVASFAATSNGPC